MHNITSIFTNAEWYEDETFILSTQAQQVFYTDDLMNGPAWKVAHHYDPRHIQDIPDALDQNINLLNVVENLELVVDLPNVDSISYRRSEATSEVIVDHNVVSLVETDDELADDRETDDTITDYLSSEDSEYNTDEDERRYDNNIINTCDTFDDDWYVL